MKMILKYFMLRRCNLIQNESVGDLCPIIFQLACIKNSNNTIRNLFKHL